MNPANFALNKRTVTAVLTVLLVLGGTMCFFRLGRLEYPTFTIKTALITTRYPGASPQEVEEEVSDVIEEALQEMGELDEVKSTSTEGMSVVYAEIQTKYKSHQLPQIWDKLRRKISDVQKDLPPGAFASEVNDDFGDVYGICFAISGDGYAYKDLEDYAKLLKKDLLLVDEVAKIDFWGVQKETIYVDFKRAKLTELGITPDNIFQTLNNQNVVQESGKIKMGEEYIRVSPSGDFNEVSQISNLIFHGKDGTLVRLKDIAEGSRGYADPPKNLMRYNGKQAIGMGISIVDGGNVVRMGEAIRALLGELEELRPIGMEVNVINYQSDGVTESLNNFLVNLLESIVIVIVVLIIFMNWQSGLLIGGILILTIWGTFIGMFFDRINLQLISLGALVLALGMLVDNAIVVADGILIKIEKGVDRITAAKVTVAETIWPLFGATLVAVLAFLPIGFNPSNAGEFCRSLFDVLAISLFLSWVLAITVTPLFCVLFLKVPKNTGKDPYDKPMFRGYRRFLEFCISRRYLTVTVSLGMLALAIYCFGFIPEFFFAPSTRKQFHVDYWRPEGTHLLETSKDVKRIEEFILEQQSVTSVTSFVGEGALRFMLSYNYESPNTAFGQLLVSVDDYTKIQGLTDKIDRYLAENFADAEARVTGFDEGPPIDYKIEARFRGPDPMILRKLAAEAKKICVANDNVRDLRDDWRQQVKVIRPEFSEMKARRSGITRSDVSTALQWNFGGIKVGTYREGDTLIPIKARFEKQERESVENLKRVQVWSAANQSFVPMNQAINQLDISWESPIIERRDRVRTITVQCNPKQGVASKLLAQLAPEIEEISLPPGYTMEWGGEIESSSEAQEALKQLFPICLLLMFIVVVWLFNSLREPIIIFLCVPLSIIGVTVGLLLFGLPFGFLAILGILGLTGMLIKNAIVLLDQVNLDLTAGKEPYIAVVDSSVSRLRPVTMAAGTTVLGMAPLISHPFFAVMAATIMSGLFAATALTLIVVPVLYCIFFRVKK
jgi:multidrug efflux pump subunit AcrB